jgi:hypothetical protein
MSLLQPGQHFEGANIVDNPVFAAPPRRSVALEERLFAQVVFAAQRAHDAGLTVSVDTVRGFNRDLPQVAVRDVLVSERFAVACEELGIPLSDFPGLSPHQVVALSIYLDTSTPATHSQKLRAAGVSPAQWKGWLRQGEFANRLQQAAGQALYDAVPLAQQRLVEAVDAGARWAIEMSLEMTGVHDRRGDGANLQTILQGIFNVLDEEIVDSAVLDKIGDRIKQHMGLGAPQVVQQSPTVQEK